MFLGNFLARFTDVRARGRRRGRLGGVVSGVHARFSAGIAGVSARLFFGHVPAPHVDLWLLVQFRADVQEPAKTKDNHTSYGEEHHF